MAKFHRRNSEIFIITFIMSILRIIHPVIRFLLKGVTNLFFCFWQRNNTNIPYMKNEQTFLNKSTLNLGNRIRQTRHKSEQLLEDTIGRIKQVPHLKAIAAKPIESTTEDERQIDNEMLSIELADKPVSGPLTAKESHGVRGTKLTKEIRRLLNTSKRSYD